MTPYGPGIPLVADSSAWLRQRDPAFAGRWQATVRVLRGSRRMPAADYLIAAAAAERGFGVLHLDAHFDTLAPAPGFVSVRLDRD